MFYRMLLFAGLLVAGSLLYGQHLAAYSDYRDNFFIFDQGKSIPTDDLKIQSFKVGGECVLYLNGQGNLKVYRDGKTTQLEVGGVDTYYATDHLAAYKVFEKLKVVEDLKPVTLSTRCELFEVRDDLIVFFDKNLSSLRIYYEGKIFDVVNGILGMPVTSLVSSDNIVAYIIYQNHDFRIWYEGVNYEILRNVEQLVFKAGKDLIAYINPFDNTFHAFYKGEDYQLEDFKPQSFRMGDGMVAYVDNSGVFKVFYNGQTKEISSFAPETYEIEDNILAYSEEGYFKVFYNYLVYELEAYIPRAYQIDWNTIAFLDTSNRIWVFSNGEKKFLTNDLINTFVLIRDLIIMNVKVNRNIIYDNGEFYEGLAY